MPEDPGGGKRGAIPIATKPPTMCRPAGKEDEAGGTAGTGEQPYPAHGSPEHAKN